ncbi:MAG: response regulator [Leptolyngbyaceae cyanobacterium SM1_3_5]|nr:response regulator [Leptolyngbyaceae cyanobacterium SM1_3_5]
MSLCNQTEDLVFSGLRVLVVDNNLDSRELLAFVLEQQGAEVATATCVDEAIAIVKQQKPDILLSEIALPEKDGYALVHQVRDLAEQQPSPILAIATTGRAGLDDRLLSLQAGFQAHVAKPIDFDALTALVLEMTR